MYYRPGAPFHEARASSQTTTGTNSATGARSLLRNRRLIGQNTVFSVYFDHLVYPDGREVFDYLSVVPRALTAQGHSGVAVLPEIDGKLALVRVDRHPLGTSSWETPRGFIDSGESPGNAALRELREETGLVTEPDRLVPLGTLAPEPGVLAAKVRLFAALKCSSHSACEGSEPGHRGCRLFSLSEIGQLVKDDEIHDPSTLVSYFRYLELRNDGVNAMR